MPDICVVHLVWAPLGIEPMRRFLRSYRAHDAGRAHELVVVFNGFAKEPERLVAARAELAGVSHRELVLPGAVQDLAAYRAAAEDATGARALCFLNSHSEMLADGWLGKLDDALRAPEVAIVGATGSFESAFSAAPRPLKPLRRRQFPPFPNPHLRTNAFMLGRDAMLELAWHVRWTKSSAHQLESGFVGISRQLTAKGGGLRVVARDGRALAPEAWPASRTFRSGVQENLLVADNRTRQYRDSAPALKVRLAQMAWGEDGALSAPPAPASRV